MAWFESLPDELSGGMGGMGGYVHQWAAEDPQSAARWLQAHERAENYDQLPAAYVTSTHRFDPESSSSIAATIEDDDLRGNAERLAAGGVLMSFAISDNSIRMQVEE